MAYKPILFNTEMVQAIKAGRKTQTRRIVRKKYDNTDLVMFTNKYGTRLVERQNDAPPPRKYTDENGVRHTVTHMVAQRELDPPCKPGDILWVRETWAEMPYGFVYRADDEHPEYWDYADRWHPSIHMPKEAARIFLRVKDVRVERLRDIGNADAIAEGFSGTPCHHENADPALGCTDCLNTGWLEPPCAEFAQLWDSTIKPADRDKCGWNADPWVWVIEFERCEKPEGWCS